MAVAARFNVSPTHPPTFRRGPSPARQPCPRKTMRTPHPVSSSSVSLWRLLALSPRYVAPAGPVRALPHCSSCRSSCRSAVDASFALRSNAQPAVITSLSRPSASNGKSGSLKRLASSRLRSADIATRRFSGFYYAFIARRHIRNVLLANPGRVREVSAAVGIFYLISRSGPYGCLFIF